MSRWWWWWWRYVGRTTGKSISHARDVLWSTAVVHLWIVGIEVWPHLMLISNVDNVFCVRHKLDWSQHGSLRDATIHLMAGIGISVVGISIKAWIGYTRDGWKSHGPWRHTAQIPADRQWQKMVGGKSFQTPGAATRTTRSPTIFSLERRTQIVRRFRQSSSTAHLAKNVFSLKAAHFGINYHHHWKSPLRLLYLKNILKIIWVHCNLVVWHVYYYFI